MESFRRRDWDILRNCWTYTILLIRTWDAFAKAVLTKTIKLHGFFSSSLEGYGVKDHDEMWKVIFWLLQ